MLRAGVNLTHAIVCAFAWGFCCFPKCISTSFFEHHSLALFNRFSLIVCHNRHMVLILSAILLYYIKDLIAFFHMVSSFLLHSNFRRDIIDAREERMRAEL